MSTSGSYTPPATPECPYAPRMTRAAALALAAGGGLVENCVVVLITDTPVIGTAGNTSATEIELNPVSPTAFGQTARVFTTFAPEAWPGVYDLVNNTITELRDDFGNSVKDVDAGGATVHTQFPWHLGSATLRDNVIRDSTLTAWATQVGAITGNRIEDSTVNLSNKTGGAMVDSVIVGTNLAITANTSVALTRARLYGCAVTSTGTGGSNTLSITDSTLDACNVVKAGSSLSLAAVQAEASVFTSTAGSLRTLTVANAEVTATTLTQSRTNAANADSIQNSTFYNSSFTLTGATDGGFAGPAIYRGLDMVGGTLTSDAPSNTSAGAALQMEYVRIAGGSVLNLQGQGARVVRSRLDADCTVNTGNFVHTALIVEVQGTTTLTAANTNRLRNKSFSDVI